MAKKLPLRKCTGCNVMKDKRDMLRIVRNNEEQFFIDVTGKANGRGAYICKSKECFETAIKNKGLERSFKAKIPATIVEELKEAMKAIE
jgi:uncharacterized protein